MQDSTGNTKES